MENSGIQPRLRARIKGRFAKEINLILPKTEETLINTLIALRADGITEATLKHIDCKLRQLARESDIANPEAVKLYIATAKNQETGKPLSNEAKNKFLYTYDKYCQKQNIPWKKPYYKVEEKTPLIPTTENVNAIINTATERYVTVFTILTETGAEGKGNGFPPLQKRIILHLAKNQPQTINETMKGIFGHYKSSWIAFNVLKKKGLIKDVTSKDYRGRQYPCFWLTDLDVFLALCEGAEPKTLLIRTHEVYPENEGLQFLIEAVPILGKNAFDVLYLTVMKKGAIEQGDLTPIFAAQMMKKLTPEQVKQFMAVVKKYPEPYQQLADYVKQTSKNLKELSDLIDRSCIL